jgi:formylglycine-generating enzyme required for sulfatase activity
VTKLNEQQKGKGWLYRLPTSAEWEYACRNASTSKEDCSFDFYLDKPTNDLSSTQANFNGDKPAGKAAKGPSLGLPAKVGSYPPNKLGLYDMHGNVRQWCNDILDGGPARVIQGSGWYYAGQHCRAANRLGGAPSDRDNGLGFRLARAPSAGK